MMRLVQTRAYKLRLIAEKGDEVEIVRETDDQD